MAYNNWTDSLQNLATAFWYDVVEARAVLLQLEQFNFAIVGERVAARDALKGLDEHHPIARDKRFEDGFRQFVCRDQGAYPKYIQMLYSSLDYKEGDKDPKKPGNATNKPAPTAGDVEMEKPWNFNDASQQYRNAIREFSNALARRENVHSRNSFEAYYNITWVAPANNITLRQIIANDPFLSKTRNGAVLIGNNAARVTTADWPGVANVVDLRTGNLNFALNEGDDTIFLWASNHVGNARSRVEYNFEQHSIRSFLTIANTNV